MKGRVAIPTSFRRALPSDNNDELYLNKGRDNTIEAHPSNEWEKFENDILLRLNRFQTDSLRIRRLLQANVIIAKLDAQGRILIPGDFKEYANIKQEVVICGVGNFFEIWNPENYEAFQKIANEHFLSDLENINKYLEQGKNLNTTDLK